MSEHEPKIQKFQDGNLLVPVPPSDNDSYLPGYEERMLLTCHIPHVVPVCHGFSDNSDVYLLRVKALTPLSHLLTAKYLEEELVLRFLSDFSAMPAILHSYLISTAHLYLTADTVFYSDKEGFIFLVLPFYEIDMTKGFSSLFDQIMKHIEPGNHDLRDRLDRIDKELKKDTIDRAALLRTLASPSGSIKKEPEDTSSPPQLHNLNPPAGSAPKAHTQAPDTPATVKHRPDFSVLFTTLFLSLLILAMFLILHTGFLNEIPDILQSILPFNLFSVNYLSTPPGGFL